MSRNFIDKAKCVYIAFDPQITKKHVFILFMLNHTFSYKNKARFVLA